MNSEIKFILAGKIPSKKNAWKRSQSGQVYIDKDMRKELDGLTYELMDIKNKAGMTEPMSRPMRVEIIFYERLQNSDLDNKTTTLLDLLQAAKIIENDKLVDSLSVRRGKAGTDYTEVNISIS